MRTLLYRVVVTDKDGFAASARGVSGVVEVLSKTRGQIVECDDGVAEDALLALDGVVQAFTTNVLGGPGPGRALGLIVPGDDRTDNITWTSPTTA